jgi:hypothetical protein
MMTIPQALELAHMLDARGIPAHVGDEVGLMRARKFYRSLGWHENHDFYILGGEVYFNVDWPPRPGNSA